MAAKNDITGDEIKTKTSSDAYRENYDKIFRKREKQFDQALTKNEYYDILSTEDCFDIDGPDA
jgi:hypothetical protein